MRAYFVLLLMVALFFGGAICVRGTDSVSSSSNRTTSPAAAAASTAPSGPSSTGGGSSSCQFWSDSARAKSRSREWISIHGVEYAFEPFSKPRSGGTSTVIFYEAPKCIFLIIL